MDIMSDCEEEILTISPDEGATGETTTSSENNEAGMQTGLSEEEKEAHLNEIEGKAILGMLDDVRLRDPKGYQDIIVETLYKRFARENRATRSKETIFSELDKLEARETEHLETSGHVPEGLRRDLEYAREDVEFENCVTLLREAKAHFGRETEGVVISYIDRHKGECYCMSCMRCHHKEN